MMAKMDHGIGVAELQELAELSAEQMQSVLAEAAEVAVGPEWLRTVTGTPGRSQLLHEVVREKLDKHIARGMLPVMRDLGGHPFGSGSFPCDGEDLTVEQAIAIGGRFRARLLQNSSVGGSAACFVRHVLYALGTREPSTTQQDLIATICSIAARRPLALGRLSELVASCEDAGLLRTILSGLIRDEERFIAGIAERVERCAPLCQARSLVVLGYSEGIVEVLVQLAAKAGRPIRVHCIEGKAVAGTNALSIAESYRKVLAQQANVEIRTLDAADLVADPMRFDIDTVLVATAAVSSDAAGQLVLVAAQPCDVALRSMQRGSVRPRIIAVASLFKLWPQGALDDHADSGLVEVPAGHTLHESDVDLLLSDVGLVSPTVFLHDDRVAQLLRLPKVREFFAALIVPPTSPARIQFLKELAEKANPGEQTEAAQPTREERESLLAVMSPDEGVPAHFAAGARQVERLLLSEAWRTANEGQFVVARGEAGTDVVVGATLWDVLRVARDDWRIKAPFVIRVTRSGVASPAL